MAAYREPRGDEAEFMRELVADGLLVPSGVPGVYGRNARFERVCAGLNARITSIGAGDDPEELHFAPLLPRRQLERVGYMSSFPHLAGTLFSFEGGDVQARELDERIRSHENWGDLMVMTDLVLTPAACYPIYPAVASRGPLDDRGVTVDAGAAYVFRSEPSGDPARLQMFRQRERVRIAAPDSVVAWRDTWRTRAIDMLQGLGLRAELEVASDPFFGRAGRMLMANQRAQELKYEVTIPIASPDNTAVASFNYHQEHFSEVFGLTLRDGRQAHTACLGFGVERIALGLFREHGLDDAHWPPAVVGKLWP